MKFPQFLSAIRSLNVKVNYQQAEEMFNYIDVNCNGTLSIDEFAAKCLGDLKISDNGESKYVQRPPSVQARASAPAPAVNPAPQKQVTYTSHNADTKGNSLKKNQEVRRALQLPTEEAMDVSNLLLEGFRRTIIARGGADSIAAVGRLFRIMDDNRDRRIDIEEMQTGLGDYGLRISTQDIRLLMDAINERPGMSTVNFDQLLYALRGELNERRAAIVMQAFAVFDKTGDGVVDYSDLKGSFKTDFHPDVRSGKKSHQQAMESWLAIFEGHVKDGKVTKEEFLDYYANVSASIDADDYFELMVRNSWHIAGGKGQTKNSSNVRVLVIFRDGTQDIVTVQDDIGVDPHDTRTITGLLRKQGLSNIQKVRTL